MLVLVVLLEIAAYIFNHYLYFRHQSDDFIQLINWVFVVAELVFCLYSLIANILIRKNKINAEASVLFFTLIFGFLFIYNIGGIIFYLAFRNFSGL